MAATAVLILAASGSASAAEHRHFSERAFAEAQAAGKPILIDVKAGWCVTCRQQSPVIARLVGNPKYSDLQILDVDYDTEKTTLRKFRVRMQSTLIAYRGRHEMARETGQTSTSSIAALLASAL